MIAFARVSFVMCLVGSVACATGKTSPAESGGPLRWSGSFRQPQMAASSVVGPATPNKSAAFGSINITPIETRPGYFQVDLSMSAPVDPNTQLAWAIFQGPCGAPGPAVAGLTEFPTIEISTSGGSFRGPMTLAIEPRGTYHANVYWAARATDVSNVMMCAKLDASSAR
jgi:hypothetical protein